MRGAPAETRRKASSRAPVRLPRLTPQAQFQRGRALADAGNWVEAAQAFEAVADALPRDPAAWLNLAHASWSLRDFETGARAACRAVALDPGSETALHLAAQCLECNGRFGELVDLFSVADIGRFSDPKLHVRLGVALTRLGRLKEAVKALLDALRRDLRSTEAYAQLGNVFQLMKLPEEARESFRNALALGRSPVEMATAILFTSLEAGSWSELNRDRAALAEMIANGHGQPLPFYSLNFCPDRPQQLAASRAHSEKAFAGITRLCPPTGARATKVIRVGYVSSDFQEHATAYLIAELFEKHDRERFDIHAYSYGESDGSPMRGRIEAAFGTRFVDTRNMHASMLAQRIRDDAIDVLVDLKGYTLHARNEVFAYRAAPIQVNFLGFPGTLGSEHYDYIVGDRIVTPIDHADGYSEKIAQMPDCYQPNDRRRPIGSQVTRAACGLPDTGFVFCCFNANYKITPEIFDRWCSILNKVDGSVLWLFESNSQARKNLRAEAALRGVDPDRLCWATALPLARHLARLQLADLFLDTIPVNAHTTASDALWAGLPLLTVPGASFASRVGASLTVAAGVPELVAKDLEEYERIALDLACDHVRLDSLRQRLSRNRDTCALFDSNKYAREFESLLVRMVDRLDRKLPPAHLPSVA